VVRSDSGPIARTQVIVSGKTAETDAEGRTTLRVAPGPVEITVVEGFHPVTVTATTSQRPAARVDSLACRRIDPCAARVRVDCEAISTDVCEYRDRDRSARACSDQCDGHDGSGTRADGYSSGSQCRISRFRASSNQRSIKVSFRRGTPWRR